MAERTVTARLVADTTGYDGPIAGSVKATTNLTTAQQEATAAAKAAAVEQRATAQASQEAAARSAEASRLMSSTEKEARAAAKDAAAAQLAVAKAATEAERQEAVAVAQTATAKEAAAKSAAAAAAQNATAAKDEATAANQARLATTANATALREVATAAKDAATAEALEAKTAADAAKTRSEAYTNSGKKMTAVGLALVGAFALAEKATSDFDKSMSGVQAVANATAPEMDKLRTAALAAGRDTAFSAKDAADAEGELVKAGVSVKDVLGGGLTGALDLAAAGQLSLADAATISANAMNTFNLAGKDVPHIADVLAAGANKSAADVKELAYAMQQGGLVAAQTGLTFEDTTAILSAFADRGLKGADAGTSLKTMLERLNNPTTQARDLMNSLGISAYDTSGKFVGITAVAGQLHDKLGGLTDQQRNATLATIFGSDAIRSATVLYNLGAQGVKGYTDAVNDQGAAARMSATQLDNLSGDLHQLKGSIDTALIQSGGAGNDVLRQLAQGATNAVNAFTGLPKPVQEAVTGFAGGAGTALLLVGGLTSIAGKAANTRKTLQELATTAEGVKGALGSAGAFMTGPWGLALAGAATAAALFSAHLGEDKIQVTDFTAAIKDDGIALGDHTTQAVAADLASRGLYDSLGKLGVNMNTVTQAAMGNQQAMAAVDQALGQSLKHASDIGDLHAVAKQVEQIHATAAGLHDQLHAQQQATAATQDGTAATAAATTTAAQAEQQSKASALAQMQHTAAVQALALAQAAKSDTDVGEIANVKTKTAATSGNTTVTNANTAAKHAQTTADKGATTASRDAAKAAVDHSKATDAAAKAAAASAAAAKLNADSTAKAADQHKAAATAARDAAAASHAAATAQGADQRASDASAAAADKASRAHDAAAKAVTAKATAAAKAEKASEAEAAAQAAAAQAAAEAKQEHEWGTTALAGWADAAAHAGDNAYKLSGDVTAEVGAMKDAKQKANDLKDALDALNGVHIAAGKAALDVQAKIHDLNKSLDDNGRTLDITTEKGRANMTQVYDLASAINAHAQAVTDETGSVKAGNDALAASRDAFDKVLEKAGVAKDQIKHFNDTLLATPALTIDVDTSKAMGKLQKLKDQWGQTLFITPQGVKQQFAHGGRVLGAGSDTSDNVPIMASPDEWIVPAAAARAVGYDTLAGINATASAGTIVKPPMIATIGGTTPQPARGGSAGPALHIENFHAAGQSPWQVAEDMAFLMRSRGVPTR